MEQQKYEPNDYRAYSDLSGRTIAVVGAGQGIGREAARAVRDAGARVVCIDRDKSLTEAVANEVNGLAVVADVTLKDSVLSAFTEEHFPDGLYGVIDIVGMARWQGVLEITETDVQEVFGLNFVQALFVLQAAVPLMGDSGGSVAFVSSVSGLRGAHGHAAYGAAKAALSSLVQSAAVELAPRGIRVNSVAPGPILTPRTLAKDDPAFLENQAANIPMGRWGRPHEVAAALAFLTSDGASYITGQNVVLDGGLMARIPIHTRDR